MLPPSFHRYTRIGGGQFSNVFKALNQRNEEVCVKQVPLVGYSRFESTLWQTLHNCLLISLQKDQIEKEATILNQFNSEYIIRTKGSFIEHNTFYLVMELARENLDTFIADHKFIPEDHIITFLIQLSLGLRGLHLRHNSCSFATLLLTMILFPNRVPHEEYNSSGYKAREHPSFW